MALVVERLPANAGNTRDMSSIPGSRRSPGVGSGGQRSVAGYNHGAPKSDITEHTISRRAWRFFSILKREQPYDLAIPLLTIYPEKTTIQKDTCTPMFIAVLFTIAKTWKQIKCPLTEEWIKKMWYICTVEYYWDIKKEWNNTICSSVDGPRHYHTRWSQRQKSYDITYMWNLENLYKWIYL